MATFLMPVRPLTGRPTPPGARPLPPCSRRIALPCPAAAPPSDDDSPAAATPIAGAATLSEVAQHDKLIDRLLAADGAAQVKEERRRGVSSFALSLLFSTRSLTPSLHFHSPSSRPWSPRT